jgi:hypothetical protein
VIGGSLTPAPSFDRGLDPEAKVLADAPATVHAKVLGCRLSFFGISGHWLSAPTPVVEGFGLATVDEIAAMKCAAVTSRSSKKDFFDLHALESRGFNAPGMFALLKQMYGPAVVDLETGRHLVRAMTDFNEADEEPDPITLDGTTWERARRTAVRLSAELSSYLQGLDQPG